MSNENGISTNEPVDITKLPLLELKALAYDVMAKRDFFQNQLNIVNNEIANFPNRDKTTLHQEQEKDEETPHQEKKKGLKKV